MEYRRPFLKLLFEIFGDIVVAYYNLGYRLFYISLKNSVTPGNIHCTAYGVLHNLDIFKWKKLSSVYRVRLS